MRRPAVAFGFAVPIALVGGLVGLGGAEFRLPVLAGPLGYAPRVAVPLNLLVSMVTVVTAVASRLGAARPDLSAYGSTLVAMAASAVVAAYAGPSLAGRLSDAWLERTMLILLVIIGIALIVEASLPQTIGALAPEDWWLAVAIVAGLAIGLASSLLGVAGGELIIPTLVFAFGMDIKTAGTASLLVSLPAVLVGVGRYGRRGAYRYREALTTTVAPMAVGSVVGALIGASLVQAAPVPVLKAGLGVILILSAFRVFGGRRRPSDTEG